MTLPGGGCGAGSGCVGACATWGAAWGGCGAWAICCGAVNRVLTSPSLAEGLSSETIGHYSYHVGGGSVGGGSVGPSVRLTADDLRRLSRYKVQAVTIYSR